MFVLLLLSCLWLLGQCPLWWYADGVRRYNGKDDDEEEEALRKVHDLAMLVYEWIRLRGRANMFYILQCNAQ